MEDDDGAGEEEGEYEEEEEEQEQLAPEDIWDDSALINAYNEAVREYLVRKYKYYSTSCPLWNHHRYLSIFIYFEIYLDDKIYYLSNLLQHMNRKCTMRVEEKIAQTTTTKTTGKNQRMPGRKVLEIIKYIYIHIEV